MLIRDHFRTVSTLWFVHIFVKINIRKHILRISLRIPYISRTSTASLAKEASINLRSRTNSITILNRMSLQRYQTLQFHLLLCGNNRQMHLPHILSIVYPSIQLLFLDHLFIVVLLGLFSFLLHHLLIRMGSQGLEVHVNVILFDSFFFAFVCEITYNFVYFWRELFKFVIYYRF